MQSQFPGKSQADLEEYYMHNPHYFDNLLGTEVAVECPKTITKVRFQMDVDEGEEDFSHLAAQQITTADSQFSEPSTLPSEGKQETEPSNSQSITSFEGEAEAPPAQDGNAEVYIASEFDSQLPEHATDAATSEAPDSETGLADESIVPPVVDSSDVAATEEGHAEDVFDEPELDTQAPESDAGQRAEES